MKVILRNIPVQTRTHAFFARVNRLLLLPAGKAETGWVSKSVQGLRRRAANPGPQARNHQPQSVQLEKKLDPESKTTDLQLWFLRPRVCIHPGLVNPKGSMP